jgi:hypothetical protein
MGKIEKAESEFSGDPMLQFLVNSDGSESGPAEFILGFFK